MNHLLAKIKSKEDSGYRKMLSCEDDEEIYEIPQSLLQTKSYAPDSLLGEDEWYVITEFSGQQFCIELLQHPFNSAEYAQFSAEKPSGIEYICAYQKQDYFFFQRMHKHSICTKKRISLGDSIRLEKAEKSIVLNEEPDALYIRSQDSLYFKKLETIAPIFKGIEVLYREATDEETEQFLASEYLQTVEYSAEKVGKANRKRIALANSILSSFNKKQKKRIMSYTHEYYPDLKYEDGKFTITSNDDLKYFLWGIEQRYYTTPVTEEKCVADSVIKL